MSNFYCEHCGAAIIDSPRGYVTFCPHCPDERTKVIEKLRKIAEEQKRRRRELFKFTGWLLH